MPTESPSLENSIVRDFGLGQQASSNSPKNARQLGAALLDRTEQIFIQSKAVRTLLSNGYENPTRLGSSVIALAAGLARVYSGDFIFGPIAAATGAKEIYNQCTTGDPTTLQRLLNDINADVDMIRTLEEGQQQSYKAIEENLGLIHGEVNTLYSKLNEMKELNAQGLAAIVEGQSLALQKGDEAKKAYREALQLFTEAKSSFASSKETYQKCAEYFVRIQEIAKDDKSDIPVIEKINALVAEAERASLDCQKGKNTLDEADEKFSAAMKALTKASSLKDEALELVSKTVQNAEDVLQAGREKADYTKACSAKIDAAQKELQEVRERSDDILQLLGEMSTDVKKAKAEAQNKLNPSDVVVGVGAGVALTTLGTPITAVALGVTAAYAWHNGTTISDTTKKVYNYFFGAPLPPPQPMEKGQSMRFHLDEKSSGYYGWMRGRQSYTYGSVDINLGDEIAQFRFDLNQTDYPICKEDLFTLYTKMFEKLRDKTLSPQGCKAVLAQLEKVTIDRGRLHAATLGLIKSTQAAYGLARAIIKLCNKMEKAAKAQKR